MAIPYTPKIYEILRGPTVAIDLSALADIGEVQEGVDALADSTARNNTTVVDLVTDSRDVTTQRFDATDKKIDDNEANAVARHEALLEAIASVAVDDGEHPELDGEDRPLLLLLLEAQTRVLGGKRPAELEDGILHELGGDDELVAAFKSAVEGEVRSWADRSRVFWALHDFIEDVTAD
jgi:hypothetical protein